ncbi:ribosyldihydronicotinamide dehydrogenase [quinone] isoform X2 [Bufo gargarizans]|uniref:ribosyldihydronicotinamide dehydrogenase [quinone] isoform X2 n=1 Tax=Bufo gargarizans TaxID=30331 RepID=UPI001CF55F2B|nr:ribosyldihydronicotinamide dehydrogenase [quinone] isoform X2 [Bufo gargarizans]
MKLVTWSTDWLPVFHSDALCFIHLIHHRLTVTHQKTYLEKRTLKMSGKNVLIVYAHQEPKSMNGSLKNTAVDVLSKMGCRVTISDLYAMNFNAAATRSDITGDLCNPQHFSYGVETMEAFKNGCLCEDILKEQNKIHDADLVILQFPLYWFGLPAIMKGWIDRCFVQGFAFDTPGYETGLLKGKRALLSFTTGGTEHMFSKEGISGDIRYLLWPIQVCTCPFCRKDDITATELTV